jgi:hypothetical protein
MERFSFKVKQNNGGMEDNSIPVENGCTATDIIKSIENTGRYKVPVLYKIKKGSCHNFMNVLTECGVSSLPIW